MTNEVDRTNNPELDPKTKNLSEPENKIDSPLATTATTHFSVATLALRPTCARYILGRISIKGFAPDSESFQDTVDVHMHICI